MNLLFNPKLAALAATFIVLLNLAIPGPLWSMIITNLMFCTYFGLTFVYYNKYGVPR